VLTESFPAVQGLLQHLDLLVFVEACIYEMDEQNEALTAAGQSAPGHQFAGGD
jgi:hypothetical protein